MCVSGHLQLWRVMHDVCVMCAVSQTESQLQEEPLAQSKMYGVSQAKVASR